jgi:hypothetical protein
MIFLKLLCIYAVFFAVLYLLFSLFVGTLNFYNWRDTTRYTFLIFNSSFCLVGFISAIVITLLP